MKHRSRNIKNAKAGQFSDASIQRVYDKYGPGTERQQLALAIMSPWVPPQGVWKHIEWDDIAVDAACASSTPLLMSAMQSRVNDWYTFSGRPGGHAGTTFKQDRWELRNYAGAVETDKIDAEDDEDVIPATKKVNALLSRHPTEVEVLISVNSDVVTNPGSAAHRHNHVVALTKPATITEDPGGDATKGRVSADLFTWGKILTWTGSVAQWQQMVHEFIVGSTRKGLL